MYYNGYVVYWRSITVVEERYQQPILEQVFGNCWRDLER